MEKLPHLSRKTPFVAFLIAAIVIFILTLSAASSVGFVPYYLDPKDPRYAIGIGPGSSTDGIATSQQIPERGQEIAASQPVPAERGVAPDRIIIKEIGLDLPVSNPQTRDLEELDVVLKDGPARYVDSALLGESGNVLIFGHSSHLPVVINQMYKAFNKIPDLEAGDSITVESGDKAFTYRVTSVKQVDAEEGTIDLTRTGQKLTIVTCDTLTGKSARYVLEAEFVGSYDL
jgi:LPXTG-site transpeptidase (sortase) family protein